MSKTNLPPAQEIRRLIVEMQSLHIKDNPYAWVMYAFPWGQKNTPLHDLKGPRDWQKRELLEIADFIKENKARLQRGEESLTYKLAISSGRGIGKSTLVAWIALWQLSCQFGSSTVITANTDSQLTGKTFGEIGKWATLAINSFWFERTQRGVTIAPWFTDELKKDRKIDNQYWYIKGELWNEDNPDSFAGAHNDYGELYIFDEASGIPVPIWKVTEGIFTERTPYKFWFVFSNPRSNKGPFFDCFHEHRKFWRTRKIDSRTVEGTPKNTYEEIIEKYGIDSRDARVEVLGEFPAQGDKQFISRSIVVDACDRKLERYDDHAALCMGVDPARFGDDSTVIRFRQGRDARSIPAVKMRGADNMQVANKCMELIEKYNPDGIFVDAGAGSGIIDRLREMGVHVFEVIFGSASEDPTYFDHRTELWARMRDWLGGSMLGNESEEDKKLIEDLVGPEYEFMGREEKIKLEAKEKMKKRSIPSPDNADALAVTFHCQIVRKTLNVARHKTVPSNRRVKGIDGPVDFEGYGNKHRGVGSDINFD